MTMTKELSQVNTIKHWIGGAEYEGTPAKTLDVENPGTGEVVSQLLLASDDDLNHAVEDRKSVV